MATTLKGLALIQVRHLRRDDCVELLRTAGILCYDSESVATLRQAVRVNVEDGTISRQQLEAVSR